MSVALAFSVSRVADWRIAEVVLSAASTGMAAASAYALVLDDEESPSSAARLVAVCVLALIGNSLGVILALRLLESDDLVLVMVLISSVIALTMWLLAVPADRGLRTGSLSALGLGLALVLSHPDGIYRQGLSTERSAMLLGIVLSVPLGLIARRAMIDHQATVLSGQLSAQGAHE